MGNSFSKRLGGIVCGWSTITLFAQPDKQSIALVSNATILCLRHEDCFGRCCIAFLSSASFRRQSGLGPCLCFRLSFCMP